MTVPAITPAPVPARRGSRGQTTTEFVGMLVFVGLVCLVVLAFRPELASDVTRAMSSMLSSVRDK